MYFSDREKGQQPRTSEEISPRTWAGIRGILQRAIRGDCLAVDFPMECQDGNRVRGTDKRGLADAICAEFPDLDWPLDIDDPTEFFDQCQQPTTLTILDLLEFFHKHIAMPTKGDYHEFHSHYHFSFNHQRGQVHFRDQVGGVLARNGLAYDLQQDGKVVRLAPPALQELLQSSRFRTEDDRLNGMLESARTKFLDPSSEVRQESLEKLWDAWERLKTIRNPDDKKRSTSMLLDMGSAEPKFRETLENEAKELTRIGNQFMIRHTETNQVAIASNDQVDYLFHRMYALVHLLLKALSSD